MTPGHFHERDIMNFFGSPPTFNAHFRTTGLLRYILPIPSMAAYSAIFGEMIVLYAQSTKRAVARRDADPSVRHTLQELFLSVSPSLFCLAIRPMLHFFERFFAADPFFCRSVKYSLSNFFLSFSEHSLQSLRR